jgi:hypothetical protein
MDVSNLLKKLIIKILIKRIKNMERTFSSAELEQGANFLREHGFYNDLLHVRLPARWNKQRAITNGDDVQLIKGYSIVIAGQSSYIDGTPDIIYDLLELLNLEYDSVDAKRYIYQLLVYIQQK